MCRQNGFARPRGRLTITRIRFENKSWNSIANVSVIRALAKRGGDGGEGYRLQISHFIGARRRSWGGGELRLHTSAGPLQSTRNLIIINTACVWSAGNELLAAATHLRAAAPPTTAHPRRRKFNSHVRRGTSRRTTIINIIRVYDQIAVTRTRVCVCVWEIKAFALSLANVRVKYNNYNINSNSG